MENIRQNMIDLNYTVIRYKFIETVVFLSQKKPEFPDSFDLKSPLYIVVFKFYSVFELSGKLNFS